MDIHKPSFYICWRQECVPMCVFTTHTNRKIFPILSILGGRGISPLSTLVLWRTHFLTFSDRLSWLLFMLIHSLTCCSQSKLGWL